MRYDWRENEKRQLDDEEMWKVRGEMQKLMQ